MAQNKTGKYNSILEKKKLKRCKLSEKFLIIIFNQVLNIFSSFSQINFSFLDRWGKIKDVIISELKKIKIRNVNDAALFKCLGTLLGGNFSYTNFYLNCFVKTLYFKNY